MTMTKKISEMIMIQIAATGSVKSGFDKVMGDGAYDEMAGDICDTMKAANEQG